jgi:hypothetical protein
MAIVSLSNERTAMLSKNFAETLVCGGGVNRLPGVYGTNDDGVADLVSRTW